MKAVSLFSGAGGLDLGFIQAGHSILWAIDNDPDAVATYRHNIGGHIVLGDIRATVPSSLPDADVMIGGFPCQGFSRANLLRSTKDERNGLYLEFLRLLRAKMPRYFLAENVRGLLSLDGGNVIRMVVEDFSDAGYRVKHAVFNAADYGVPQNRWRVIIIGARRDIMLTPSWPKATHSTEGSTLLGLRCHVSVGAALASIPEPESKHRLLNHVCSRYKVTNRDFTGHRRTNPDKPSPTILARGNGRGGVCAIQHPRNHRRLSVRESAIVQTFPKGFRFFGSLNSMYRQVGNAVPVLLARRLAQEFQNVESAQERRAACVS